MGITGEKAELILGNCLDKMNDFEDCCIDLTVTSPPYDQLRSYKNSLEWGESIWKPVLEELFRITKNSGVVVWIVGDSTIKGSETGTSFKQALWAIECGFNLHDTMIYSRYAMPSSAKRYNQDFEYMFVFVKNKISTFNFLKEPCKYAGVGTSPTIRNKDGVLKSKGRRVIKDEKKKSNIWHYSAGAGKSTKDKIAHGHPAIFPEKLVEDHIVSWSNEDDVVFDPFMGSGTTGKMALLNKRKFIGIEKVETYFQIARTRIDKS